MARVTETELLSELDAFFRREPRLPGDLDAEQLAEKYNISINTARSRMRDFAGRGGWLLVEVWDDNSNRTRMVLRPKGE